MTKRKQLRWAICKSRYYSRQIYLVFVIVNNAYFYSLCFFAKGLPAVMVTASLGIVAGKDGIESYVSDQ